MNDDEKRIDETQDGSVIPEEKIIGDETEEGLPLKLREGDILNLIPTGLDRDDLNLVWDHRSDMVRLIQGKFRSPGSGFQFSHSMPLLEY